MIKKFLLSILVLLCITSVALAGWYYGAVSGGGAPTTPIYESNYATGTQGWGTTCTVAITATTTANSVFILYADWTNNAVSPTGATYDGNAMTLSNDQIGSSHRSVMYYYYAASPASGAKNLILSLDGSTEVAAWSAQFSGASATQDEDAQEGTTAAADPQDITLSYTTSTNNCLLVSGVTTLNASSAHSVCSSTGQTLFTEVATSESAINGGYFDLSTAGAKDQCFHSDQTWVTQIAIGMAIKPYGS